MTKAPDLIITLRHQLDTLEELKGSLEKDLSTIFEQLTRSMERVERLKTREEELQNIRAEKDKSVSELEVELTTIRSQLETVSTELNQIKEQLLSQQQTNEGLLIKEAEKKEIFSKIKNEREIAERDFNEQQEYARKIESELEQLTQTHEENILDLRTQVDQQSAELTQLKASYNAFKALIREKAIEMPEIQVIKVLESQTDSSVDFIQRSTGLKQEVIVDIVRGLASHGVVEFVIDSGIIKVKRPISLS